MRWSSEMDRLILYRVYPLWLLPCTDACSSNSRCFWHRAKLLRFGLDANRDPEYLEGSGTAGFYSGSNALGKVFTPALPNTTWAEMRGYLNNSAILFVGDSTLRGLMYALLSKLNGSLRYWEASHSQLIFESLAGGFFQRTDAKLTKKSYSSVIAFAYFPLFWSRRLHRRTLVDVISQSLGRIAKKNVDLFIGGTQWLSADEMKRLGYYLLHNKQKKIRRVIIKSHQAGFHIPNYLTHHFSLEEHLWKKRQVNEEVWRLGGELKWARIDAYQLTWSNLFHFSGDFQCISSPFEAGISSLYLSSCDVCQIMDPYSEQAQPTEPSRPPPTNKRFQQTQAQVNEVVDIMRVNMEKVLERDAKLAQLDDRADALQAGASQFEASAGKLKNKYWWKNMKMTLALGVVGLILLIALGWYIFGGKSEPAAAPTTPATAAIPPGGEKSASSAVPAEHPPTIPAGDTSESVAARHALLPSSRRTRPHVNIYRIPYLNHSQEYKDDNHLLLCFLHTFRHRCCYFCFFRLRQGSHSVVSPILIVYFHYHASRNKRKERNGCSLTFACLDASLARKN
uniref:Vesicle associated membrane protein n=1 Tax=Echinococcus granulosus TaxID=6210 RepID=A0A068WTI0_ECHGR|nr:vesicle associated membrane protein [Echinococcus granulosus]